MFEETVIGRKNKIIYTTGDQNNFDSWTILTMKLF